MNNQKAVLNPITEQQFDRVAMATERGQLKKKMMDLVCVFQFGLMVIL